MKTLATIDARALAAAYQCQAQNDVRYYLNGVLIQPDPDGGVRAVGTDGHRMIVVTDRNGTCDKDIIVELPKTLVTKLKQKRSHVAKIQELSERNWVCQIYDDMDSIWHTESVNIIDGRFPDWECVIPNKLPVPSTARPGVNAHYIAHFGAMVNILDISGQAIQIVANGDNAFCIVFGSSSRPGIHARGVVMPIRIKGDNMNWLPPVEKKVKKAA